MPDDIPLNGSNSDDVINDAYARFKRCQDRESGARSRIQDDMRFAEGDSRNNDQWPSDIVAGREIDRRPALTNNLVRQHNLQIVNDARQHKPGIEIRATGGGATYQAAKVFEGLCRHIEYESNAQAAYDTATYHQVYGGRGWWRVVTEYADSGSFDLCIRIKRVPDAMSCYLDPDIQEYDGSDANFGFAFTDMERRAFKAAHPDVADDVGQSGRLDTDHGWVTDDLVRVADYYRKVTKPDWLTEMPDGSLAKDSDMPAGFADEAKSAGLRRRKIKRAVIEQYKIAGDQIIGRAIWPGQFVPIVRVMGEETTIDGQYDIKGHTRSMISAQQMHNYFYTAAVEHVALQGKTPWVGPMAAFEGYEDIYNNANTQNYAYLPFNHLDDNGNQLPAPKRAEPPVMAQAFIQGLNVSSQLIMDVSGQHQATLGEPSNEKSGVAIQQRQRQGDNATAHYIDHQAQAIRFTGRILVDLIPKVMDTARVAQILGQDGKTQRIQVDPAAPAAHQQVTNPEAPDYDENAIAAIFNPSVGEYAVVADIGPSFATKRQDAFNAFSQIMQQNGEAMKIGGDLMWKNADFPGADDLAARWRRTIPPNLLTDDVGPPPEVQQMQDQFHQHAQAMDQNVQQMQAEIQRLGAELDAAKRDAADQNAKQQNDMYRAETDRIKALATVDPDMAKVLFRQVTEQALQTSVPDLLAHHNEVEQATRPLPAPMDAMQPDMGAPQ